MITEKSKIGEIRHAFYLYMDEAVAYFYYKNRIRKESQIGKIPIKKAVVTYYSEDNNKWIVFNLKNNKGLLVTLCIDTVEYMHLYVITVTLPNWKNAQLGCYHLTPHFFQRVMERNHLEGISKRELIAKVLNELVGNIFDLEDPREGYTNTEINVPTNLGRFYGHTYFEAGVQVLEFTTCVPHQMMSYSKQNKYKKEDAPLVKIREEMKNINKRN